MDAQLYKMNLVPREDPVCYPQNESSCVETFSTDVIRRRSSAGKTNCAHDLRDHPCITAQLFENCLHEQRTGGASSKKKQPWIPSFPHQGTNTGDGRYGKAHCRKRAILRSPVVRAEIAPVPSRFSTGVRKANRESAATTKRSNGPTRYSGAKPAT